MDILFKDGLPHLTSTEPQTEEEMSLQENNGSLQVITTTTDGCCSSGNAGLCCNAGSDADDEPDAKKRKAAKACIGCKKSHVSCDMKRPCGRCVKRGCPELCVDAPVKPPRAKKDKCRHSSQAAPILPKSDALMESLAAFNKFLANVQPVNPTGSPAPSFPSCGMLQPESTATPIFSSQLMGDEFEALADFSRNALPNGLGTPVSGTFASRPFFQKTEPKNQSTLIDFPSCFGNTCKTCPFNHDERYYLVAASAGVESLEEDKPTSAITLSDRLGEILKAKAGVGLLKPFDYAASYAKMERRIAGKSSIAQQRIRSALQDIVLEIEPEGMLDVVSWLQDDDEQWSMEMYPDFLASPMALLAEEAFERMLLEYDRTFSVLGMPAALWRRTGEICRANREFAALVGLPLEALREGKLTMQDLMAEDTEVNYWEKWASVAADGTQKAVITSCTLQRHVSPVKPGSSLIGSPTKPLTCSFSFTIRRDAWNVPTVVVGNFLPVNPPPLIDVLMERLSLWGETELPRQAQRLGAPVPDMQDSTRFWREPTEDLFAHEFLHI